MTRPSLRRGRSCRRRTIPTENSRIAMRSVTFQYSCSQTLTFCSSFPGSDMRIWRTEETERNWAVLKLEKSISTDSYIPDRPKAKLIDDYPPNISGTLVFCPPESSISTIIKISLCARYFKGQWSLSLKSLWNQKRYAHVFLFFKYINPT